MIQKGRSENLQTRSMQVVWRQCGRRRGTGESGRSIAVILMILSILMIPRESTADQRLEQLTGFFDQLVFGSEIDPALRSTVVAKWLEPIRVSVQGRVTQALARQASRHLNTLAGLTGLTFQQAVGNGSTANFHLFFVRRQEMASLPIPGVDPALMRRLSATGGCYFITARKPPHQIVRAYIVVNIERRPEAIDACLLEEIAQSLGLPNDTDLLRPSLFSDRDRLTEPSANDALVIQTLYDADLPAGLTRAAALPRVRGILARRLGLSLIAPGTIR